jgi:hypothetical protein
MYFTLTGSRLQKREQIRYFFLKYACQEAQTSFFFSPAKYTFWSIFACAWFENSSLYTYRLFHTPFGIIFNVLFIHFWPSSWKSKISNNNLNVTAIIELVKTRVPPNGSQYWIQMELLHLHITIVTKKSVGISTLEGLNNQIIV